MVLFMCNLVCYVELWEIYKSGSVFGLWLTLGVSFSKPISYFSTVIRSCTSLVHTAYGLLSHTAPCVAAYTAFFSFTLGRMHSSLFARGRTVCLMTWPLLAKEHALGRAKCISTPWLFHPLNLSSPLLLLLSEIQSAEFSILLWLLEQGKPPCRFPWLSLSPGCSRLRKAGRDPAFCRALSAQSPAPWGIQHLS